MLCYARHRHTGIPKQVVVSREWIHRSLRRACTPFKLLLRHIITPNLLELVQAYFRDGGIEVFPWHPRKSHSGQRLHLEDTRVRVNSNSEREHSGKLPTNAVKKHDCPNTISFSTAQAIPK